MDLDLHSRGVVRTGHCGPYEGSRPHGGEDINWRERLARVTTRGVVDDATLAAARCWWCCPVGRAHEAAPGIIRFWTPRLLSVRIPEDTELLGLGVQFYHALRLGDVTRAGNLLDRIDDVVLAMKRAA